MNAFPPRCRRLRESRVFDLEQARFFRIKPISPSCKSNQITHRGDRLLPKMGGSRTFQLHNRWKAVLQKMNSGSRPAL